MKRTRYWYYGYDLASFHIWCLQYPSRSIYVLQALKLQCSFIRSSLFPLFLHCSLDQSFGYTKFKPWVYISQDSGNEPSVNKVCFCFPFPFLPDKFFPEDPTPASSAPPPSPPPPPLPPPPPHTDGGGSKALPKIFLRDELPLMGGGFTWFKLDGVGSWGKDVLDNL